MIMLDNVEVVAHLALELAMNVHEDHSRYFYQGNNEGSFCHCPQMVEH